MFMQINWIYLKWLWLLFLMFRTDLLLFCIRAADAGERSISKFFISPSTSTMAELQC